MISAVRSLDLLFVELYILYIYTVVGGCMSSRHEFEESSWIVAPSRAIKGRGAVSNSAGRFEVRISESVDDGWWQDEPPVAHNTQVTSEYAKTILSRNQSPDLPFAVSLNPYRGCEHGCIYCFACPTHSCLGLSPGLDFETGLFAKVNAVELLRSELAADSYVPSAIALGVNTDAYQPCERKFKLTRGVIEVLKECNHPPRSRHKPNPTLDPLQNGSSKAPDNRHRSRVLLGLP